MYVDSHCHLSYPELADDLDGVLARMRAARVGAALNVCTTLPEFPRVLAVAEREPDIVASVGVHPDTTGTPEPTVEQLVVDKVHAQPLVSALGFRRHAPAHSHAQLQPFEPVQAVDTFMVH